MVVIRGALIRGGGGSMRGQVGDLILRVLTLRLLPVSKTMVDISAEINFGHAATRPRRHVVFLDKPPRRLVCGVVVWVWRDRF